MTVSMERYPMKISLKAFLTLILITITADMHLSANNRIVRLFGGEEQIQVRSARFESKGIPKSASTVIRNYKERPNEFEKKSIRYIIETLAKTDLTELYFHKPKLYEAKSKVNHIHPLRFLAYIFSEKDLKAWMRAIKKKSWVWKQFFKGLKSSLQEESDHNNMNIGFINDFAQNVGIDPALIKDSILQKHWSEFVDILIERLSPKDKSNRYDM